MSPLPDWRTLMPDRSAIFSDILARNALRIEAKLPLLPVGTTYRREVERARWREHVQQHQEAVHAVILREQRARYGSDYPQSAGGRWAMSILVHRSLRASFRTTPADH